MAVFTTESQTDKVRVVDKASVITSLSREVQFVTWLSVVTVNTVRSAETLEPV